MSGDVWNWERGSKENSYVLYPMGSESNPARVPIATATDKLRAPPPPLVIRYPDDEPPPEHVRVSKPPGRPLSPIVAFMPYTPTATGPAPVPEGPPETTQPVLVVPPPQRVVLVRPPTQVVAAPQQVLVAPPPPQQVVAAPQQVLVAPPPPQQVVAAPQQVFVAPPPPQQVVVAPRQVLVAPPPPQQVVVAPQQVVVAPPRVLVAPPPPPQQVVVAPQQVAVAPPPQQVLVPSSPEPASTCKRPWFILPHHEVKCEDKYVVDPGPAAADWRINFPLPHNAPKQPAQQPLVVYGEPAQPRLAYTKVPTQPPLVVAERPTDMNQVVFTRNIQDRYLVGLYDPVTGQPTQLAPGEGLYLVAGDHDGLSGLVDINAIRKDQASAGRRMTDSDVYHYDRPPRSSCHYTSNNRHGRRY